VHVENKRKLCVDKVLAVDDDIDGIAGIFRKIGVGMRSNTITL